MNRPLSFARLVAVAGFVGAVSVARADTWLYASPAYSTGSYGSGATTQIEGITYGASVVHTVLNFKDRTSNKLAFNAWVPFLSVQGSGVITSDGRVIGRRGTVGPTTTTTGWGDWMTQISDTYEGASFGSIDAYAGLKLVTGTRALGTGENDYDFGATYNALPVTIGKRQYTPFVGMTYTVMGKPPGLALQNYVDSIAGVTTFALGGYVSGQLSYTGSAQLGFPAATAVSVSWGRNLFEGRSAFHVGLSKGLSNGSPNWSAWMSLGVWA